MLLVLAAKVKHVAHAGVEEHLPVLNIEGGEDSNFMEPEMVIIYGMDIHLYNIVIRTTMGH